MATAGAASSAFRIRIAGTGDTFDVPPDRSILYVLIDNGYRVPSSCSDGRCGTCKTRYLEGRPDHRDRFLEPDERSEYLTVCVSRCLSDELVLDLPAPGAAKAPVDPWRLDRPIAIVDAGICVACLTCVRACEFGAAHIDAGLIGVGGIQGAAIVDVEECTGCGLCAAACPTGAIGMTKFSDGELALRVDDFLLPAAAEPPAGTAPHVVVFACPNSLSSARAFAADDGLALDIVEMPCTGRVNNLHLMRAFEDGADGVIVAGCEPGACLFKTGNTNAGNRLTWIRHWLDDVGLDAGRGQMLHLPEDGAERFAKAIERFAAKVGALGPSPVKATREKQAASRDAIRPAE